MSDHATKLQQLRTSLNATFPERREVIDGILLAVLAGEHVFLLGPPGTAKSALTRAVAKALGGIYFERLLTKFTVPEELFGPISLKALEQDRYARVTAGMLPSAEFCFLDETFKANSAILNSLLTMMNERVFANDGNPQPCPLITLFGASNELPEGKELEAYFDRFLVRFNVDYLLRPASLRSIFNAGDAAIPVALSLDELRDAQRDVAQVVVSDDTIDALIAIRDACKAEGFIASDRRWKQSLKLARASAYLATEDKTTPEDLVILTDVLWREPKDRPKLARLVGKLADPITSQATEILDAARETAAKVVGLRSGDRSAYLTSATQALQDFQAQKKRLAALATNARRRTKQTIADATDEISQLHTDFARSVSQGLGLGGLR